MTDGANNLEGITRKEFDNGLVLLMEKRPNTSKATLLVGVKVGSVNENEILSGGSHFNEHLLFKSNSYRSARQLVEDLEYSGIIINAYTNWKYTVFYAKSPHRELAKAVEILFQAATNFNYNPKEFSTEREVVLTEVKNHINSPERYSISGLFIPTLFRGTPLERPIEGTTDSMEKITKEQLEGFKKEYYVPNNMVLVAVGKFDEEELIRKVEDTFGTLESKKIPTLDLNITLDNENFERYETREDISQLYMCLGYRTPGSAHEDHYKLDLLTSILSEGLSSRMFRELREKRGIGYDVGSLFHPMGDEGIFCTHVSGFDPKRFKETKDIIFKIFKDLKTNSITDREFKGTKTLMISKYDDKLEIITNRALFLLETEFYKTPYDFRNKESYINEISKNDLRDLANEYLTDEYSLTVLAPNGFKKND